MRQSEGVRIEQRGDRRTDRQTGREGGREQKEGKTEYRIDRGKETGHRKKEVAGWQKENEEEVETVERQ